MIPPELFIDSVEQLKSIALGAKRVNWGQLSKYKKNGKFPLHDLLDAYPGSTTGEKAYRAIYGSPTCSCGKPVHFYNWKRGFSKFCSAECAKKEIDWELAASKARETSLKRHGGIGFSSEKIKEKIEKTNLTRYGHAVAIKNEKINEKKRQTTLARHGVEVPYQNELIAKRGTETKKTNTWKKAIQELEGEYEYIDNRPLVLNEKRKWRHVSCGSAIFHDWSKKQRPPLCRTCFPAMKGESKFEAEIISALPNDVTTEKNKRFYFGSGYYELDIFLPDYKIGIEYNGLFWHSEEAGKDKNYHSDKRKFFESIGIRVIFIFEHEWNRKKEVCVSALLNAIGKTCVKIPARKCSIELISVSEADEFISKNHLSGGASSSIRVGLRHGGELVSIGTFAKSRYSSRGDSWELIRFCSKVGTVVIGGLSKIISFFQETYKKDVVSYCDLRWGTGEAYVKAGFIPVKKTNPGYWYFDKDGNVYHRSVFQKKKLRALTGLNSSEREMAKAAGLMKFWDCGHILFEKKHDTLNHIKN